MKTKVCPQCKKTKPIEEFNPRWSEKYHKFFYSWCKKCTVIKSLKNYRANRSIKINYAREYRKKYPEKIRQILINSQSKVRREALSYYSKGEMKCACCGETEIKFLAIDHINGGGNEHRKKIGFKIRGTRFVYWLKKNNYPPGFQVLCHNCNMAKGFYGQCPHTVNRNS